MGGGQECHEPSGKCHGIVREIHIVLRVVTLHIAVSDICYGSCFMCFTLLFALQVSAVIRVWKVTLLESVTNVWSAMTMTCVLRALRRAQHRHGIHLTIHCSAFLLEQILVICFLAPLLLAADGAYSIGDWYLSVCTSSNFFTSRPTHSAGMPILFLLSGPKMGMTRCPGKREIWHGTFIGAKMWEYSPQNCHNFEFWP